MAQIGEERDAVHHRHVEVQEDEGRAQELVQRHQRLGPIPRGDDGVAVLHQHILERVTEVVVVLGEETDASARSDIAGAEGSGTRAPAAAC